MFLTLGLGLTLAILFGVQVAAGITSSIAAAGLVKPLTREGQWWRVASACFLHGSFLHLVANLSALRIFGGVIETRVGWKTLMLVYMTSGLVAERTRQPLEITELHSARRKAEGRSADAAASMLEWARSTKRMADSVKVCDPR